MPTETSGMAKCQHRASSTEPIAMRVTWMAKIAHNCRRGSEKTRLEKATIATEMNNVTPPDHATAFRICGG